MCVILESIEMPRCEGRLVPIELFDRLDTLESAVLHGHCLPRPAEWRQLVHDFGDYYALAGDGPIEVDQAIYHKTAGRYALPDA